MRDRDGSDEYRRTEGGKDEDATALGEMHVPEERDRP